MPKSLIPTRVSLCPLSGMAKGITSAARQYHRWKPASFGGIHHRLLQRPHHRSRLPATGRSNHHILRTTAPPQPARKKGRRPREASSSRIEASSQSRTSVKQDSPEPDAVYDPPTHASSPKDEPPLDPFGHARVRLGGRIVYRADNSKLKANTHGISYRMSPDVDTTSDQYLGWNQCAVAAPCLDHHGCVKHGPLYLPTHVNGILVLKNFVPRGNKFPFHLLRDIPASSQPTGAVNVQPSQLTPAEVDHGLN